jgi:hypothetical protein
VQLPKLWPLNRWHNEKGEIHGQLICAIYTRIRCNASHFELALD